MTLATLPRASIGRSSVERAVRLLQQAADVLWEGQAEANEEFTKRTQIAAQATEAKLAQARARRDREANQAAVEREWLSNLIKEICAIEQAADAVRATSVAMRLNVLRGQLVKMKASQ
jgi:hypothetical protein